MTDFFRHFTRRYRAWLIAVAAILLVISILEAGHAHGVFAPEDDHCTLCQHSFALGKTLLCSTGFILPLLLGIVTYISYIRFTPSLNHHFAAIRAPPSNTNTF